MFIVDPNRTFVRTVTVYIPSGKTAFTKATFEAKFKQLSEDQIKEMQDDDKRLLDEVLIEVHGVGDAEGNELSGADAVDLIKRDTSASAAAVSEYINSTVSKNRRLKNS